jgi:hypothetical protein
MKVLEKIWRDRESGGGVLQGGGDVGANAGGGARHLTLALVGARGLADELKGRTTTGL